LKRQIAQVIVIKIILGKLADAPEIIPLGIGIQTEFLAVSRGSENIFRPYPQRVAPKFCHLRYKTQHA
jgi:hypothetical protein